MSVLEVENLCKKYSAILKNNVAAVINSIIWKYRS